MNLELLRLLCYIYMELVQHRASKSVSEKTQSAIVGKLFSFYIARGQCWVFQIPKQVTWTARMRYLSRKKYWLYAICHDKVFASFLCIACMILIMVYIKQQAKKIVSSKGNNYYYTLADEATDYAMNRQIWFYCSDLLIRMGWQVQVYVRKVINFYDQ